MNFVGKFGRYQNDPKATSAQNKTRATKTSIPPRLYPFRRAIILYFVFRILYFIFWILYFVFSYFVCFHSISYTFQLQFDSLIQVFLNQIQCIDQLVPFSSLANKREYTCNTNILNEPTKLTIFGQWSIEITEILATFLRFYIKNGSKIARYSEN